MLRDRSISKNSDIITPRRKAGLRSPLNEWAFFLLLGIRPLEGNGPWDAVNTMHRMGFPFCRFIYASGHVLHVLYPRPKNECSCARPSQGNT